MKYLKFIRTNQGVGPTIDCYRARKEVIVLPIVPCSMICALPLAVKWAVGSVRFQLSVCWIVAAES